MEIVWLPENTSKVLLTVPFKATVFLVSIVPTLFLVSANIPGKLVTEAELESFVLPALKRKEPGSGISPGPVLPTASSLQSPGWIAIQKQNS